jgi:predicted  nucleic acid-binding Zn-ribbon protein
MTSVKCICRIEDLERQLSETRQTAKSKQSAAVAAELEVKNLQAWLARTEDELERVKSELRAKVKSIWEFTQKFSKDHGSQHLGLFNPECKLPGDD